MISTLPSWAHFIAIADGIQAYIRTHNVRVSELLNVLLTGRDSGDWIVVYVASIVIHMITGEGYSRYNLESYAVAGIF